jgi:hypothetical protein
MIKIESQGIRHRGALGGYMDKYGKYIDNNKE